LRVFKGTISPTKGIELEIGTHEPSRTYEPKFEIDVGPLKMSERDKKIKPLKQKKASLKKESDTMNSHKQPQKDTEPPQSQLLTSIVMDDLDLESLDVEFMSDEYIIEFATKLQLFSSEEDYILFKDITEDEGE